LAAAAERRWGTSLIITPNGMFSPDEVLELASASAESSGSTRRPWKLVPEMAKTAAKDVRLVIRARRFRRALLQAPLSNVAFVWQRHVPFHSSGQALARMAGCPFVLSVHALMVREARQWGIKRPGWGLLMESLGEKRILHKADLVACVSEELAEQVREQGIPQERILVTPNGVDLQLFHPRDADGQMARQLGLAGKFVLGWVGSFRSFHGLDHVFDALEELQSRGRDLTLLLIGLGPRLQSTKDDVERRGLKNVVFGGSFPHDQMPRVMSTMHTAVVVGSPDGTFHYSPVKVREYMAMGLPVIAARLGELDRILENDNDAILVDPTNPSELADAIERLMDDADLRARLGERARQRVTDHGSWESVLNSIISALGIDDL
jgi:glycosyltransferase involved in cell wall biosynthesis